MSEWEAVIIDHYQIHRRLAKGGMSEIYLAQDLHTERMIALKLVQCAPSDHCERFRREVAAVARLHHPHILPALASGEWRGWAYLVLPYVEYGTLARRLNEGPISLQEAKHLFTQLASALQYAHEQGILHRDIKPTNILLDGGHHVYLADFGLAQQVGASNGITQTGCLIGTPDYMAPELAEQVATPSSDLYALGILLYQMLTGRVPFQGSTPVARFLKHVSEPVPLPSQINPAIPSSVDQVLVRALAKEPRSRFATASDLALSYQQALVATATNPLPVEIKIVPTEARLPTSLSLHSMKREQKGALALLLCLMPLFLGFSFAYLQGRLSQTALLAASLTGKMTPVPTASPPSQIQPQGTRTPSQLTRITLQKPGGTLNFTEHGHVSDETTDTNHGQGNKHHKQK